MSTRLLCVGTILLLAALRLSAQAQDRFVLQGQVEEASRNGDLNEAIRLTEQIVALPTDSSAVSQGRLAETLFELSNLYLEFGDVDRSKQTCEQAADVLCKNQPASDWRFIEAERWKNLVEAFCIMSAEDRQEYFDIHRSLLQASHELRLDDALEAAEKLAERSTQQFGERHPFTLNLMLVVQEYNIAQGKTSTAQSQLNGLINTLEQINPPGHPASAAVLTLLAILLEQKRDIDGSLRVGAQAIARMEYASFTYNQCYPLALQQHALLLFSNRSSEEALPMLRKACTSALEDATSSLRAVYLNNLSEALALIAQKRLREHEWNDAAELFSESIVNAKTAVSENSYRVRDLTTSIELCKLASTWTMEQIGAFDTAQSQLDELESSLQSEQFANAISVAQDRARTLTGLLGSEHPLTLQAIRQVLELQSQHQDKSEEEIGPFYDQLIVFSEQFANQLGNDHRNYADLLYEIARGIGHHSEKSIEFARKAIQAYEAAKLQGIDDHLIAQTLLGELLEGQVDQECVDVLMQAIKLWQSRESSDSYHHFKAARALGNYYKTIDYPYEARLYLGQALNICKRLEPRRIDQYLSTLNDYANALYRMEEYQEAHRFYDEAKQILESTPSNQFEFAPGSTYKWVLYNLAQCNFELEQPKEAESLLQNLISLFPVASPPPNDGALRIGYYLLAKALRSQKRFDEAEEVLSRVLTIVQTYFAKETMEYGEYLLEEAELKIDKRDDDNAKNLIADAFAVFQAVYAQNRTDDFDVWSLLQNLDRMVVMIEGIGEWNLAVEVRIFVGKVSHVPLQDWPNIAEYEKRQLTEAKDIARSGKKAQDSVRKIRERTKQLNNLRESGFPYQLEKDPTMESAIDSVLISLGDQSLILAEYYESIAGYLENDQQFFPAIEFLYKSVEMHTALLGEDHPRTIEAYVDAARIGRRAGMFQASEKILLTMVGELTKTQGDQFEGTLLAQLELARIYTDIRDFAKALPITKLVAECFATQSGKSGTNYASSIETLGMVYQGLGELDLAVQMLTDSNSILATIQPLNKRTFVENSAKLATCLARQDRELEAVVERFKQVRDDFETFGYTSSTAYVDFMLEYADVMDRGGHFDQAIELYQKLEGRMNENGFLIGKMQKAALNNGLAIVHRKLGKYQEALEYSAKAIEIRKSLLDSNSESTNGALQNLGLSEDSTQLMADCLYQYALLDHLVGNDEAALAMIEQRLLADQQSRSSIGLLTSEQSTIKRLEKEGDCLDLLLSTLISLPNNSLNSIKAFEGILQQKGMALDMACRQRAMQQSRQFDSKAVALAAKIRLLEQELSNLALTSDQGLNTQQLESRRIAITQQIAVANIELSISMKSIDRTEITSYSIGGIIERIPPDAVLIEFVQADRIALVDGHQQAIPHYIEFVLSGSTDELCRMYDLGQASHIDALIDRFRVHVQDFPQNIQVMDESKLEDELKSISAEIYSALFSQCTTEIESAKSIIVSPDASLCSIPFQALVESTSGKYLIEDKPISYVNSARDLLRLKGALGKGTLILAGPNYDADVSSRANSLRDVALEEASFSMLALRSSSEIDLRSLRWKKLPGAEAEANDIEQILQDGPYAPVSIHLHNAASEDVLKAAQSPRVLHLATHGFYVSLNLENNDKPIESHDASITQTASKVGLARLRTNPNPLLRSGIVLAGANRSRMDTAAPKVMEDGWVTAQEIAGMNFRNTQLVVLSACESGLGDVANGQGVQGIRRAFTNAGAQSILTSLFKVPDAETRELMRAFYTEFAKTSNATLSLAQSQRNLIATRRDKYQAAHPFFWASFVLLGTE